MIQGNINKAALQKCDIKRRNIFMSEYKYLVMVSAGVNSNKYYKMLPQGNGFVVEYGRVGCLNPARRNYDGSQFYTKYDEKIRKGYVDQTHLHQSVVTEVEVKNEYKEIENSKIRKFINNLLSFARTAISKNYTVSDSVVTRELILEAQQKINELKNVRGSDSYAVGVFNEYLQELFTIIPRKMQHVSSYLATSSSAFSKILEREQDLLDVMETQVRTNVVSVKNQKNSTMSDIDILEAMGLEVREITEKEEEHIKKSLGVLSVKYINAYRVENPKTRAVFNEYRDKVGKEKKIKELWHGSKNENWWSIVNNGLLLRPQAQITGKMFGHGIYFANKAIKSSGYISTYGSRWANGKSETGYLAIYDVLYGTPFTTEGSWSSNFGSLDYTKLQGLKAGADCLHAKKSSTGLREDEIIVYKEEQTTIKYLVEIVA